MFRESVRRFAEREIAPNAARWRKEGVVDRDLWRKAGAAGLLCAAIPEEYGGAGGTFRHEAVIIDEICRVNFPDFGAPLHSAIVAPYVLHYGTEEQKRRWLPRLATGELVGAIAMTEPGAGSDLQGIRTRALQPGGHRVAAVHHPADHLVPGAAALLAHRHRVRRGKTVNSRYER